eukprot:gnl/TRDRNA2_/TRDRNA2_81031_c0_seq1.p1 gnl/TRDRNA2_/TRDRNA2_81031_c0~~gnl/TRDRNA2_/TRDRNA2_81031_c0_seq1.p1  ORF type:complete len:508 (-),score=113.59 gnl/TRDRNA2_/TRDRNA2_81031_c0_seq1:199-1722(-)
MMPADPTEMVSCGRCGHVNMVPFGLDKFKCFNCGAMVQISREQSAACAAVASTVRDMQQPVLQGNTLSPTPGSDPPPMTRQPNLSKSWDVSSEASKTSKSSTSFFGKLQKTMDSTMQKVDSTISKLVGEGQQPDSAAPKKATTVQNPEASSQMTLEEQQLQWALDASLKESQGLPTVPVGQPAGSQASQGAGAQVAQQRQVAEDRAGRAEIELQKVRASEAKLAAEKSLLQKQLADQAELVQALTAQLDSLEAKLEEKTKRCATLESALTETNHALQIARSEQAARSDDDHQDTFNALCTRISELEATLMRATHFAPDPSDGVTTGVSAEGPGLKQEESVGAKVEGAADFAPPPRTAASPTSQSGNPSERLAASTVVPCELVTPAATAAAAAAEAPTPDTPQSVKVVADAEPAKSEEGPAAASASPSVSSAAADGPDSSAPDVGSVPASLPSAAPAPVAASAVADTSPATASSEATPSSEAAPCAATSSPTPVTDAEPPPPASPSPA